MGQSRKELCYLRGTWYWLKIMGPESQWRVVWIVQSSDSGEKKKGKRPRTHRKTKTENFQASLNPPTTSLQGSEWNCRYQKLCQRQSVHKGELFSIRVIINITITGQFLPAWGKLVPLTFVGYGCEICDTVVKVRENTYIITPNSLDLDPKSPWIFLQTWKELEHKLRSRKCLLLGVREKLQGSQFRKQTICLNQQTFCKKKRKITVLLDKLRHRGSPRKRTDQNVPIASFLLKDPFVFLISENTGVFIYFSHVHRWLTVLLHFPKLLVKSIVTCLFLIAFLLKKKFQNTENRKLEK